MLLLCYAAAAGDKHLEEAAMQCPALRDASPLDCCDLVVLMVSKVSLPEPLKLSLLRLLRSGIPAACLAEGMNEVALSDCQGELAVSLLEAHQAPPKHSRAGRGRLFDMPASLGCHGFAWQVISRHQEAIPRCSFRRLLPFVRLDFLSLEDAVMLTPLCLRHQQPETAREVFLIVQARNLEEGVQLMCATELPLTSLQDLDSDRRAQILEEVMLDSVKDAPHLLSCIQKDFRQMWQLLLWAGAHKCLGVATSQHLHSVLHLVLTERRDSEHAVRVGRHLMCMFAACNVLRDSAAEHLPLEWLEDLGILDNDDDSTSRHVAHVVAQALLAQLERYSDDLLVEDMPQFWWLGVWGRESDTNCERAVCLLARWCSCAGQGQHETRFACSVLSWLPLTRLPNPSVLYDFPALPAQAIGIRAEQLACKASQDASRAHEAARTARQKASEALREARCAQRAADTAHTLAQQALREAGRAADLANDALRASNCQCQRPVSEDYDYSDYDERQQQEDDYDYDDYDDYDDRRDDDEYYYRMY